MGIIRKIKVKVKDSENLEEMFEEKDIGVIGENVKITHYEINEDTGVEEPIFTNAQDLYNHQVMIDNTLDNISQTLLSIPVFQTLYYNNEAQTYDKKQPFTLFFYNYLFKNSNSTNNYESSVKTGFFFEESGIGKCVISDSFILSENGIDYKYFLNGTGELKDTTITDRDGKILQVTYEPVLKELIGYRQSLSDSALGSLEQINSSQLLQRFSFSQINALVINR